MRDREPCSWPWKPGDDVETAFCVLDEDHDGPHMDDALEEGCTFVYFRNEGTEMDTRQKSVDLP